jgi:hypothetical protein
VSFGLVVIPHTVTRRAEGSMTKST